MKTNRYQSLIQTTLLAGLVFLLPHVTQAQTLLLRFPFTDTSATSTTTASDTSTGGVNATLHMVNDAGAAANFHGTAGGGVSGLNVALDLSTNSDFSAGAGEGSGAGNGPLVAVTNTALNFGAVQTFTATIWFKANAQEALNNTTGPRIFILGPNGIADKGVANSISLYFQQWNEVAATINTTEINAPTYATYVPTNQWLFWAITYDGTTATIYQGTDGTPVSVATSAPLANNTVTLNNAAGSVLLIGNRPSLARAFDGWINDFRFYTNAANANFVEDIRWAALAPTNLAGAGINNETQASLTWNALANAASYNVSRSATSGGPYTQIASGVTANSYVDTSAANGNIYYYVVSAVNASGDQTTSAQSPQAVVPLTAPPTVPGNFSAAAGNAQVTLSWIASTGSPAPITYTISRSTVSGSEVVLTNVSTAGYVDANVVNGNTYYYEIFAVSGDGAQSAVATEVSASPVGPPPSPMSVMGALVGNSIELTWTDADATSYNILRSTSVNGTYTMIASGVTGTTYTDSSIVTGVTFYYYEVVGVNGNGSGPSSISDPVPYGQGNQLVDPGFETAGTAAPYWTEVGNQGGNGVHVTPGPTYYNAGECPPDSPAEAVVTHNGTNVANIYGSQFSTGALYVASYTQQIPAAPAGTWAGGGWAYAPHEDLMGGANNFHYEIDFLDVNNVLLASYESFVIQNLTCGGPNTFPLDTWVYLAATNQMRVTSGTNTGVIIGNAGASGALTAPANTASVRYQVIYNQNNNEGGSIYFDDCELDLISGEIPPIISAIHPNGIILCTNTALTTTATSGSSTVTNIQVIAITHGLIGSTNSVTNKLGSAGLTVTGLGTASANVSYALTPNLVYTVTVIATDANGFSSSASATFDTLAPALVIEAEDFNYSGGQFIDTPSNGGLALYANAPLGESEIDYQKNPANGTQAADGSYYRNTDAIINGYASPVNGTEQKYVTAAASGDTNDVPVEVGYNGINDWLDYSRTFGAGGSAPAGTYYVYARLATVGAGAALNFAEVSNPTQQSQTTTQVGSFSFTDNGWNTFNYVPLLDQFGNLVSITLSGVQTLRSTVTGNPNIDFYMLTPAVPVLTPSLSYAYPDGLHPFQPTNSFTFTVSPANGASIASSGIDVVLNGVDITANSNFKLTQASGSWTASYPIASNAVYAAVINVTNTAGLSSTISINFDTFNPANYQWEAVDYDFTANGVSGLFIDNPVPSCDTTTSQTGEVAANSYFGYPEAMVGVSIALQGTDIYFPDTQPVASDYYRADGVGSQPASDYVRPKFLAAQAQFSDPKIGPINIGYYNTGNWLNYTRTYPTNTFYIWGRLAGGAGPFSGTTVSLVTNGYGTATQMTNVLGTFADANAAGWQAWHWIPMLDTNGNMAVISLGGQETLKVTSGNNLNTEFFMLVPAPPQFSVAAFVVAGQLNLSFPTAVGHVYTVLFASSLAPANWAAVGSTITGDGNIHVISKSLSGTQGFYSIGVQ